MKPATAKTGFKKAYLASSILQAALISMAFLMAIASGEGGLSYASIALAISAIPFVPILRKGGVSANLSAAAWISRVFAAGFAIIQLALFVYFTKTCGEGSKGEGSPGAFIIGMVFVAAFYFCPWLLTALRSLAREA